MADRTLAIIPRPQSVSISEGAFTISSTTTIQVDASNPEMKRLGNLLAARLQTVTGYPIRVINKGAGETTNTIILSTTHAPDSLGKEGYWLKIDKQRATLNATHTSGIFYGLQTIAQLLPSSSQKKVSLPAVEIIDKPRHTWRGMMLDAGRYFFPVEDVKKMIDYMVMYKLNTFQWHLTEDQGWRIEIKKYPELTSTSAWRDASIVGHLNDQPRQYDGKKHGGYYTQEQVREIIAYAAARYITVIPEIEMPGHSVAALAAYPELSCTGGPFKVSQNWGVHEDVYCAGNEQTFTFLQDVLSEVADLFPSALIHIGGDECPKVRWKSCAKCQARISQENLKDEHGLQSYFIKRIENFLLTKNKNIIGWDEILEGGLAPNAMVMSWRGIIGGITAAKQHHGVVMTPRNPAYTDYYQGDPANEPLTIGGMNALRDVYAYDPVPAGLTKEESKYILGSQANVWTEYIADLNRAEYMMMPRLAALAEVVWTEPRNKSFDDFAKRMQVEYQRYKAAGINHSLSAYQVRYNIVPDASSVTVSLYNDVAGAEIRYTTDGTEPGSRSTRYSAALTTQKPLILKAASFVNGKQVGATTTRSIVLNKASGKNITFDTNPDRRPVAGNKALVNNLTGSANFRDGEWTGYYGKEMVVTIDLGEPVNVKGIRASFMHNPDALAFVPAILSYMVSADGKNYTTVETKILKTQPSEKGSQAFPVSVDEKQVRYIRVSAQPQVNAGGKTWMYADEIVIDN
ncbi:family 20 glycosylhydrolase [Fulvivirgaceae bacterium PWU4]|uniref:beta-N-acetylhexosaminidase n=1 Tax=Chryseosolibacter histidini TaxID=2782349 RepID=A0AAP2DF89_9BACT|nr:family 20 glycosylhydrolase [Chryseosolibacter histidini]MBT1695255.1 family 20 glycosylhydrolase [Chryseosolibacter histidini]